MDLIYIYIYENENMFGDRQFYNLIEKAKYFKELHMDNDSNY